MFKLVRAIIHQCMTGESHGSERQIEVSQEITVRVTQAHIDSAINIDWTGNPCGAIEAAIADTIRTFDPKVGNIEYPESGDPWTTYWGQVRIQPAGTQYVSDAVFGTVPDSVDDTYRAWASIHYKWNHVKPPSTPPQPFEFIMKLPDSLAPKEQLSSSAS